MRTTFPGMYLLRMTVISLILAILNAAGPEADSRVQILNLPTRKVPQTTRNRPIDTKLTYILPETMFLEYENGIYGTGFTGLFFS